jgi:hypothetical protein
VLEGVTSFGVREQRRDIELGCGWREGCPDRSGLIEGLAFEIGAPSSRIAVEAQADRIERTVTRRELRRIPFAEMEVGEFDGAAFSSELLRGKAAPQDKVETLAIEPDPVVDDIGPVIGKPDLRQRVDQCRRQVVRQADVGAEAGISVGRVTIVVGGDEAPRSEIEGEATGLEPELRARSEGVRDVIAGIGLYQFERVDFTRGDRRPGIAAIDAAVVELGTEPQPSGAIFGRHDCADVEEIVGLVEARAWLAFDCLVAQARVSAQRQTVFCMGGGGNEQQSRKRRALQTNLLIPAVAETKRQRLSARWACPGGCFAPVFRMSIRRGRPPQARSN